ncbi:MAG: SpoIID/LytB domain-containing protein, partial [Acidimicrobiales bacterium]|nr:SpoIID/LytB domain-containing protein [Acidimicrobiales bacterium]
MRSTSWLGRASVAVATGAALATTAVVTPPSSAAQGALIPALQIDGRGFGHGVGMAQDGALAMGHAGASLPQILAQFYPGTSLAKAGSGPVRVPVYAGNNVEMAFPEGGEVRGNAGTVSFAPGTKALVSRDGQGIRVRPSITPTPPPTTSTTVGGATTTTGSTSTTTSTTTLFPVGERRQTDPIIPASTTTSSTSSTTTTAPSNPGVVFSGPVTVDPEGDGRVGLVPRNRRYRGVFELTPLAGGVRFVNQVGVETYLRGMGEVRNPSWPAPSLQAQAVAARTYALRAMAAGGELCDTQRCQVYIGSDAEYAAMDKAVGATAGQVLTYGKGLASAVYSANGGGHSASREEGFGLAGPSSHPYLRAAPYLCPKPDVWSVTLALAAVAKRLNYKGTLTGVVVAERGASGRATRIVLQGDAGDAAVTGLAFDAALGLKSTLFSLKTTMAAEVADIKGGSILQAPPEDAAAL